MNYFINERSVRLYAQKTVLLSAILLCLIPYSYAQDQDTIFINPTEIEEQFLLHNLGIIAAQYDIEIADAAIMQAKTWPNPELSLEDLQLFKPNNTEEIPGLFNSRFWQNRTFSIALSQKFVLGNKRKYHIQQQIHEKEKALMEFEILLYTLKKDLRTTIINWYIEQKILEDIHTQYEYIHLLHQQQLVLLEQGQISKAQVVRIQSLLWSISKELKEQELALTSITMDIKEILHFPLDTPIALKTNSSDLFPTHFLLFPLEDLMIKGKKQQLLFNWWNAHIKTYELEEQLQKSETIPDIDFSLHYDRGGNTHLNFLGIGFTMDLPIWNRNKGNRRITQWEKEQQHIAFKQFAIEWEKQLRISYDNLLKNQSMLQEMNPNHLEEMENMMLALQQSLLQKNISLIEYLDFFEAFKESKEHYYDLQRSTLEEQEKLNFLLGQSL